MGAAQIVAEGARAHAHGPYPLLAVLVGFVGLALVVVHVVRLAGGSVAPRHPLVRTALGCYLLAVACVVTALCLAPWSAGGLPGHGELTRAFVGLVARGHGGGCLLGRCAVLLVAVGLVLHRAGHVVVRRDRARMVVRP